MTYCRLLPFCICVNYRVRPGRRWPRWPWWPRWPSRKYPGRGGRGRSGRGRGDWGRGGRGRGGQGRSRGDVVSFRHASCTFVDYSATKSCDESGANSRLTDSRIFAILSGISVILTWQYLLSLFHILYEKFIRRKIRQKEGTKIELLTAELQIANIIGEFLSPVKRKWFPMCITIYLFKFIEPLYYRFH